MRSAVLLAFVFGLAAGSACQSKEHSPEFRGISFVGSPRPISQEAFNPVIELNANAIALMPFAYGALGNPELTFQGLDWQWWGESSAGTEASILMAKECGLQVMIKPQLWLDWGSFTGDQYFNNEADWLQFEADYRAYIMVYARMSAKYDLPVFCIGTELCKFAEEREDFWRSLIVEIRGIYHGKLTYAANWDSYERLPFWDALDLIGIDAYFPLSESEHPTSKELQRAWYPYTLKLSELSDKFNKPILFTEWGYRSIPKCTERPWEHGKGTAVDLNAQTVAYEAIIAACFQETWFSGGFVWKWFPEYERAGGAGDNRFTPQNKPAEEVLRKAFRTNVRK